MEETIGEKIGVNHSGGEIGEDYWGGKTGDDYSGEKIGWICWLARPKAGTGFVTAAVTGIKN